MAAFTYLVVFKHFCQRQITKMRVPIEKQVVTNIRKLATLTSLWFVTNQFGVSKSMAGLMIHVVGHAIRKVLVS